MKILITGGTGYIASVIANLALQNKHQVRVVDNLWFEKKVPLAYSNNPDYEFIRADFREENLLNKCFKDVDIVIHAAAVVGEPASKKFPNLTHQINYEGSMRLIEKVRNSEVKGLVFLSTCSNYGISEGLATEETPLSPLSLYAKTKTSIERYLMEETKDLNWVICRLATAYGSSPRMRFDLTVNDFTMKAFTRKYIDIFLPYTRRPYVHVFDVARVLLEIIDKFNSVKNNVLNVGFNGENHQKIHIAEIIKRFIPELRIEIVKRGADARDYRVDFSKLERCLGIKNTYIVEDGVKEVLKLLRERIIANPHENRYYNTTPELGKELKTDR